MSGGLRDGGPWHGNSLHYDRGLLEQNEIDRADAHIAEFEERQRREAPGFDVDFEVWFWDVLDDEHYPSMTLDCVLSTEEK